MARLGDAPADEIDGDAELGLRGDVLAGVDLRCR
jgi:hypothetical protein